MGKPMQGYCLISCDPDFSRVTLYVENGQTLTDRSGTGGFYYEGWLVGPAGAISLGAFNVGPDGHGSATRTVASSQAQPGRAERVRVTVEPFGGSQAGAISVLEGRLIWLDTAFPAWPEGGPGDWDSRAAAAGLTVTAPQGLPAPQTSPGTVATVEQSNGPSGGGHARESRRTPEGDLAAADDHSGSLARQFGGDSPPGLTLQTGVAAGQAHQAGVASPAGVAYQPGVDSSVAQAYQAEGGPAVGTACEFGTQSSAGVAPQSGLESFVDTAPQSGRESSDGVALPPVLQQPIVESPAGVAPQSAASAHSVGLAALAAGSSSVGVGTLPGADEASGQAYHADGDSRASSAAEPASASPAAPVPEQAEGPAAAPANRVDTFVPFDGDVPPTQAPPAPSRVNPLNVQVQLVQRHPMTPRASGSATLNLRRGSMTIHLRGLPSPMALGRDRTSGRPFNAYRVWLVNQRNQVRTPVGYCERAWGENFRFQADGLPLNRNDTILVTVEDRSSATSTGHAAPQVLIGSYEP